MKLRFAALCLILFASPLIWAQDPSRPELEHLEQQGKLVTVKLVPQDKNLSIFLSGKKAVDMDLEKAILEVVLLEENKPRRLQFVRKANGYLITDEMNFDEPKEIEVKTKVRGQTETFKFKVRVSPQN